MCGIVGILGREPVAGQLVDALKRLEYRGYDSAGVATLEHGAIVGAGSTIAKDVPADALALTRAEQKEIPGYAPKYRAARAAAKAKAKKS